MVVYDFSRFFFEKWPPRGFINHNNFPKISEIPPQKLAIVNLIECILLSSSFLADSQATLLN